MKKQLHIAPEGKPLNIWIEPWGVSISSADADWLAGWIVIQSQRLQN